MATERSIDSMSHQFDGRETGAALLVMLLLVVTIFSTVLVSALSNVDRNNRKQQKTSEALAQAKDGLLAYASTHERPGVLPCPDTNNDGSGDPNANTGCFSRIGRLPWKQLKLPDPRDGSGERLWYAVSADFANVPSSQIVNNEDAEGLMNVCGTSGCGNSSPIPIPPTALPLPASNIAAIVFSAGPPLEGNDRKDGADTNPNPALNGDPAKKPENYLDSSIIDTKTFNNATGSANGNDFVAANRSESFNDQLLSISPQEVFSNVNKRMETKATLAELAGCIAEYGKNNNAVNDLRLPWAAPLTIDVNNGVQFDDLSGLKAGRFPYRVNDSANTHPAHRWSTTFFSTSNRNTFGACSSFPKWWNNWKPYLFYAVADNFTPDFAGGTAPSPNSCASPSGCLRVNSGLGKFAAVVIFSGKKLATQVRITAAEKQDKNNYLEDVNSSSIGGAGTVFMNSATSSTFNDVIVCINPDMSLSPDCN